MGLTRKKVTVRTKKGKTFQRSVMVRAEAIGKRAGGKKLNSMNPWEAHHTAHVDDSMWKGGKLVHNEQFARNRGTSGPGSSHSGFAHLVGLLRTKSVSDSDISEHQTGHSQHATERRDHGNSWASYAMRDREGGPTISQRIDAANRIQREGAHRASLIGSYGSRNVHEVYQDPRKHVR